MAVAVYDNFDGASLNASLWNSSAGVATVSGGSVTLTGNNTTRSIDTSGKQSISPALLVGAPNSIIWSSANIPTSPASAQQLGMNFLRFYVDFNSANIFAVDSDGSKHDTGIAAGATLREFRIDWLNDGSAKYYIDGVLKFTTSGTYVTAQYLYAEIYDTGKTLSASAVRISDIGIITDTVTSTDSVTTIHQYVRSLLETTTLAETLVSSGPRTSWSKLTKDSTSWTNTNKS